MFVLELVVVKKILLLPHVIHFQRMISTCVFFFSFYEIGFTRNLAVKMAHGSTQAIVLRWIASLNQIIDEKEPDLLYFRSNALFSVIGKIAMHNSTDSSRTLSGTSP